MEEDLALIKQEEMMTSAVENKNYSIKQKFIIAFVALVLITIALLYFLLARANNELSALSNEVTSLKKDNESFKSLSKEKGDTIFRVSLLETDNYISRIQHNVEGGVVTPDFEVAKFSVAAIPIMPDKPGDKGYLSSTIDLIAQPGGKSGYIGQGKFSVTDRELKAMILDILDKVKAEYNPLKANPFNVPQWDDGSHLVTIRNYEVGTYEKGVFKLKGE